MTCKKPLLLVLLTAIGGAPAVGWADTSWVEQGPGPILNGSNVAISPNSPEAGAVVAIAPSSRNSDLVYVATANGGIWRSTDASTQSPHWTPLTDKSLPALSIASLALSPISDGAIFAGTGSLSSLASVGSTGFGIARSLDGGQSWSVIGGPVLSGRRISSVVVGSAGVLLAGSRVNEADNDIKDPDGRTASAKTADAAAARPWPYGLYRSHNIQSRDPAKVVFQMISGSGTGLPRGGIGAIAADPAHPAQFYTSISARDGGAADAGVYVTINGGLSWRRATGSGSSEILGLRTSDRILLAVHGDAKTVAVYAAVIDMSGMLTGVFRSVDRGATWAAMGVPSPAIFPGRQGGLHGALIADPKNPSLVFISGDRQSLPNAEGCGSYVGAIFRGNAAAVPAQRWKALVCDNAQGTAPHADSRDLAFDAAGNLLEADDGGLYALTRPNSPGPKWVSRIGSLRPTEFHSIAYDSVSRVIFGGAQDNGVPVQLQPDSFTWSEYAGGDGAIVAVDTDQAVHPGTSYRYTAYTQLQNLDRSTWDASNNFLASTPVELRIVAGSPCRKTLAECDGTAPFYTPMVLNKINPRRMLIGTKSLYESANGGDTLTKVANLGDTVGGASSFGRPMIYGGKLNGKSYPGMFYAGSGTSLFHRVEVKGKLTKLAAYHGADVRTVAVNPNNYQQVFVLDTANRLWASADEGEHFFPIIKNLHDLTAQVGTIAVYAPDGLWSNMTVVAGGFGIFQLNLGSAAAEWTTLGTGFPNALVGDLQYDQQSDKLVAGTVGRGAWTLTGFFTGTTAVSAPERQASPKPFGNVKQALPSLVRPAKAAATTPGAR